MVFSQYTDRVTTVHENIDHVHFYSFSTPAAQTKKKYFRHFIRIIISFMYVIYRNGFLYNISPLHQNDVPQSHTYIEEASIGLTLNACHHKTPYLYYIFFGISYYLYY